MDFFAISLIVMLIVATLALILYSAYRMFKDFSTPAH